jgi:hypothetical protein
MLRVSRETRAWNGSRGKWQPPEGAWYILSAVWGDEMKVFLIGFDFSERCVGSGYNGHVLRDRYGLDASGSARRGRDLDKR